MAMRAQLRATRALAIAWQCAVLGAGVPVAAAECWTRSDGKEICTSDPTGLRAVWWFWFALVMFVAVATGCVDRDWWCCEGLSAQDDGDDEGGSAAAARTRVLEEGGATLAQPLLDRKTVSKIMQDDKRPVLTPVKPVYRYL